MISLICCVRVYTITLHQTWLALCDASASTPIRRRRYSTRRYGCMNIPSTHLRHVMRHVMSCVAHLQSSLPFPHRFISFNSHLNLLNSWFLRWVLAPNRKKKIAVPCHCTVNATPCPQLDELGRLSHCNIVSTSGGGRGVGVW